MSQTAKLYPHYLDISRDLDETIRLYKEAGFWDNAWDVTKGVLYGGSENNQWANYLGWGLMAASMFSPLGAGRLAGSLAMRAAPRLLGRFATRGAGRMAANAATRAGAKGVATAAGQAVANTGAKAVANTGAKAVANTGAKAVANTGAKAGTGAVANTAARTSGRGALPSTKEWVDAWNGSIGSRGGWNAIMPTATKNMGSAAAQTAKSPGLLQQAGQRMAPYTAKAKQLWQQGAQKLAPYSAQAGQPMSQWTGKQWAGELAKSFVGASKNNKLNWANFATVYGLGTATGHDDIAQARLMAPWALQGARRLPEFGTGLKQGLRNGQRAITRNKYFKANPGTQQEYQEFAQRWRNGGALKPGTAPAQKPAPQTSMSSAPSQTSAPNFDPVNFNPAMQWKPQWAPSQTSAPNFNPVNFNPAMQWAPQWAP